MSDKPVKSCHFNTLQQAISIFNLCKHRGYDTWFYLEDRERVTCVNSDYGLFVVQLTEFETVAIAEKYFRGK